MQEDAAFPHKKPSQSVLEESSYSRPRLVARWFFSCRAENNRQ
ncbi:hypothetical protein THTE_2144 [Thermogutta terrifontis]|uniref:Uncharacterized protein n=1 Tax=Thermogutta terrifontis TaxID=1331910 RepID=A0A286RFL1_9BACT|nr:hypothetical protein THTE_2144 [Thermogutta terrifontis]